MKWNSNTWIPGTACLTSAFSRGVCFSVVSAVSGSPICWFVYWIDRQRSCPGWSIRHMVNHS